MNNTLESDELELLLQLVDWHMEDVADNESRDSGAPWGEPAEYYEKAIVNCEAVRRKLASMLEASAGAA